MMRRAYVCARNHWRVGNDELNPLSSFAGTIDTDTRSAHSMPETSHDAVTSYNRLKVSLRQLIDKSLFRHPMQCESICAGVILLVRQAGRYEPIERFLLDFIIIGTGFKDFSR